MNCCVSNTRLITATVLALGFEHLVTQMTSWCANRLSKGLRGIMGGPEGGAVCRPQPVNRRFRVSRYLARKSALVWNLYDVCDVTH